MSIYLDKLSSSGLDEHDAKILNFEFLEAQECKELSSHHKEKAAIKIPYFKPSGEPLSDIEGASQFYRVRYLDTKRKGFAALTKQKNNYDQPKGAKPTAYWPTNNSWEKVAGNPLEPLIITEGEFKAAKACKEGFSTVAVGGANNWHLKGRSKELIRSLQFLSWIRRPVYLCFDSDYLHNKTVVLGLRRLSDALTMGGAYVYILTLPEVYSNGDKTGLDDFLVSGGNSSVSHLHEMIEQALPYCDADRLFKLNERYVIVTDLSVVYDTIKKKKKKIDTFKSSVQRTNLIRTQKLPPRINEKTGDVEFSLIYRKTVEFWLDWPLQNVVDGFVFEPGADNYVHSVIKNTEVRDYNLWNGFPVEPVKGDVSLFLTLVDHIFKLHTQEQKDWFLRWLAYPLQNPGAKLYTACVVHGEKQGTGKSLIGYTMAKVYGPSHWLEIKEKHLNKDFNAIITCRQFVLADEITGIQQRKVCDLIKAMITSKTDIINEKHIDEHVVRNCTNYYFTSNHPDSFYMEDTDRRLFIVKTPTEALSDEFFKKYDDWYEIKQAKEAAQALLYYFLNDVDTSNFNPKAKAMHTDSKQEMFELTQSDLGEFVRQIRDYPEVLLAGSSRDLFSSKELLNLYDPFGKGRVTSNGVSREMARASVPTYERGKKVRVNGTVTRYYILRNMDKWAKASLQDVVDHIRANNAFQPEATKF